MNTLTKMARGFLGQLKPRPAVGDLRTMLALPAAEQQGGMPLMEAFKARKSGREFSPEALPVQQLSNLLWAAIGINRAETGGHTAPSAMFANEIDVYVALPEGLYYYVPESHELHLVVASDVRPVTGYQDFVDNAPLDLIYVANHGRMKLIPESRREAYAATCVGTIAQNVYLYCASTGLSTVLRGWFDSKALGAAMSLTAVQHIVLAQTVGLPASYVKPSELPH